MKEREPVTEMLIKARHDKSSKSLWHNFYVVLHPATRSSHLQMFFKIDVLETFLQNSQENTCARVSFLNKVAGLKGIPHIFLLLVPE